MEPDFRWRVCDGRQQERVMADGSGNSFLGFVLGGVVVVLVIIGIVAFNGGFGGGGGNTSTVVKIEVPKVTK
jgi:hypothetical protein